MITLYTPGDLRVKPKLTCLETSFVLIIKGRYLIVLMANKKYIIGLVF